MYLPAMGSIAGLMRSTHSIGSSTFAVLTPASLESETRMPSFDSRKASSES